MRAWRAFTVVGHADWHTSAVNLTCVPWVALWIQQVAGGQVTPFAVNAKVRRKLVLAALQHGLMDLFAMSNPQHTWCMHAPPTS